MNMPELRKNLGLSQRAFADKFRLSVKTVQSWEQGIYEPNERTAYLINYIVELENKLKQYEGKS